MTETAKIVVQYEEGYVGDGSVRHEIVLDGPADSSFIELLTAATPPSSQSSALFALVPAPPATAQMIVLLDRAVTLGQMADLFEFETLYVDNWGRGGDLNWATATEVFEAVIPFGKTVRAMKGILGVVTGIQFADERKAIKEWDDTDEISMELRQMVFRERTWRRATFDTVFALTRDRGGVLLRALGYRRSGINDGGEFWTRDEDDSWSLPPTSP